MRPEFKETLEKQAKDREEQYKKPLVIEVSHATYEELYIALGSAIMLDNKTDAIFFYGIGNKPVLITCPKEV